MPTGFEPATTGLKVRALYQLVYGTAGGCAVSRQHTPRTTSPHPARSKGDGRRHFTPGRFHAASLAGFEPATTCPLSCLLLHRETRSLITQDSKPAPGLDFVKVNDRLPDLVGTGGFEPPTYGRPDVLCVSPDAAVALSTELRSRVPALCFIYRGGGRPRVFGGIQLSVIRDSAVVGFASRESISLTCGRSPTGT